jgi:hypothetical protein
MPAPDFARECAKLVETDFAMNAEVYRQTFQMQLVEARADGSDGVIVDWKDLRDGEQRTRRFGIGDGAVAADVVAMGIMDELMDR